MELTAEQKATLHRDGYVMLPGAVPRDLVDRALRAINSSLGANGLHPDDLPDFRARSYCPELQGEPVIVDLVTASPLWGLAGSAIGELEELRQGQIALRFPTMDDPATFHYRAHIDGTGTKSYTTTPPPRSFTALVQVLLSDLPRGGAGNLAVWPGSHHLLERYFREHGIDAVFDHLPGVDNPTGSPASTLLDSLRDELGGFAQITGEPGDAVLCHYQLAHAIGGNASPHIRYAVNFRLNHAGHEAVRAACLTDVWGEWEGMRGVAGAARAGAV